MIDCIALHQVISKFNKEFFNKYSINISNYPTLPSLAFANFRSSEKISSFDIPIINDKEIYSFIKESYTGGRTDVFIPSGKKLYVYDINSLFPFVMRKCDMPVGNPIYFEGDITLENPDAFGFFECEVEAPENMDIPLLQTRVMVNGRMSTISPLGK
jgi:hypothetical protein